MHDALKHIGAIYKLDNELVRLEPAEQQHKRQLELKSFADACFVWIKEYQHEVPLDNNATELTLCSFCIGKYNWKLIDTIWGKIGCHNLQHRQTVKTNGLKVYDYVEHLLTEETRR